MTKSWPKADNYEGTKMHLVIPMAGLGSRFSSRGYKVPKPLLPVGKIRLFELVLANLISDSIHEITFIAPRHFQIKDDLKALGGLLSREVSLVEIDYVTEGPASTVELALPKLDMGAPLVVANSDQYLDCSLNDFYGNVLDDRYTGAVVTMTDSDSKWSYAEVSNDGMITRIAEKEVISNYATAGVYGFRKAEYFFDGLDKMKAEGVKVNGEYYVGPVYNYLDSSSGPIKNSFVGNLNDIMFGLGTPEDYEFFLRSSLASRAEREALNRLGNRP